MGTENNMRLRASGPIDSDTGFPLWFEDTNGVRLELGLNRDPLNPDLLIPAIGEMQDPAAPLSFPNNFPDESFYFLAEAELQVGGNGTIGRARVILALEAAFGGTGTPKQGANVVFARIRVRMDKLIPGERYKVIHPYGVIDGEDLQADDRGRVFYTADLGIVEGDPTAALRTGQVAPFLVGTLAAPTGYIGDGATEQMITGSPFNTNFVVIEGARIRDGGGDADPTEPENRDRIWTNTFTVQGRRAKRTGAWLEGATYSKSSGGYVLTVQARSLMGQDLRLVAPGIHFKLDEGQKAFYTGLGQAVTLPSNAKLINVTDQPPTHFPVTFTDRVIVESAVHDRTTGTLTVIARSSDPSAVLTIPQLTLTLTTVPQSFYIGSASPAELIVRSDRGGEGRQHVVVRGTPAANTPQVKALIVPPPSQVFAEAALTLDGSASLGATRFTWSQTSGTPVTLTGANTSQVSFTPTLAGDYGFKLIVQGDSSIQADTSIVLSVKPKLGLDTLTLTRQEYRTSTRQFRIEGNVNQLPNVILVKFRDKEEQAIPDINGDWSVRRTLRESEVDLVPAPGTTIEVRSKRGSINPSPAIRIRN